jgi:hypothetical protein
MVRRREGGKSLKRDLVAHSDASSRDVNRLGGAASAASGGAIMVQSTSLAMLVAEKLAAFERLQPEFETSFQYVQAVQGQRPFGNFSIADTVRYLDALWVCERKDGLLSVPRTLGRYEGRQCLELLRDWQAGETTGVVLFLQRKLDTLPFGELTRQLETGPARWLNGWNMGVWCC